MSSRRSHVQTMLKKMSQIKDESKWVSEDHVWKLCYISDHQSINQCSGQLNQSAECSEEYT